MVGGREGRMNMVERYGDREGRKDGGWMDRGLGREGRMVEW